MVTLKRLAISFYRSCLNTEFNPHPNLSTLVGPNGSGKTNILSSIMLLNSLVQGRRHVHRKTPFDSGNTVLKTTFSYKGKSLIHTAKLDIETDEHNTDEITGSEESWYAWELTQKRKRVKISLEITKLLESKHIRQLPLFSSTKFLHLRGEFINRSLKEDMELLRPLSEIASFVHSFRYYSAAQFTDPSRCPISFDVEADGRDLRGISIKGHNKLLFDVYRSSQNKDKFSEFLALVDKRGIGLVDEINFEEIEISTSEYRVKVGGRVGKRERTKLLVIPRFIIGGNTLSPSQLSEGTFKTIALLFYLVTDKGSLLLIEEPEVCVHHGLLESIVELIKVYSRQRQIIMTTHSDAVLDQLEAENVFAVSNDSESGTTVNGIKNTLGSQEMNALRSYLKSEGTLGEYWRRGGFEDHE